MANKIDKYTKAIKKIFEPKSTEELLKIWKDNDRETYSENAFSAIGLILNERNVDIPNQLQIQPECVIKSEWDLNIICKKRKMYLALFVALLISYISVGVIEYHRLDVGPALIKYLWIVTVTFLLLFLYYFLSTVRIIRNYKIATLIFMAIGVIIPVFSPFILLSADLDIYSVIIEKKLFTGKIKRALSPFSVYSFLFAFFPFAGLLVISFIFSSTISFPFFMQLCFPIVSLSLALFAFREIIKSKDKLYGITLTCVSMFISLFMLLLFIYNGIMLLINKQ